MQLTISLGLALPFLAGLWGVRGLFVGFTGLADTLPARRQPRRACFLRRLTLAWSACYTAGLAAIAQVEAELATALASLDGWAEGVLGRESGRFRELSTAWRAQARRIRAIDHLLTRADPTPADTPPPTSGPEVGARYRQSEQARQANLARLRQVRARAYQDLMGTLAWVRELVSMIHLARFTGAPASRTEELAARIAAAVEGISAVTWQDNATDPEAQPATGPSPIPT